MQPSKTAAAVTVCAVFLLSNTANATLITASGGGGLSTATDIHGTEIASSSGPRLSWTFGATDARQSIAFDSAAGHWRKAFSGIDGSDFDADDDLLGGIQTAFDIEEWLVVGGGSALTDWHVEIVTPGWEFQRGNGNQGTGRLPDGTLVGSDQSPSGVFLGPFTQIDFFFDQPLIPGSALNIRLAVAYIGLDPQQPEIFNGTLQLSQYPTIPEPATFALLGLGLAGLGCFRRKNVAR